MFRKIVVPLDTSPVSEQAAWKAGAIARGTHATVHLVHVYEPRLPVFDGVSVIDEEILALDRAQYERHLRHVAADLTKRFGCKCVPRLLSGVPATEIGTYARQEGADLIVMSTHGRTGVSRAWFGSVADRIAREASVPVVMVRAGDSGAAPARPDSDAPFSRILIALDGSESAEQILPCLRSLKTSEHAEILVTEVVSPVPLPFIDYPDAGVVTMLAPDVEATAEAAAKAGKYLAKIARKLARDGAARVETKVVIAPNAAPAIVDLSHTFRADLVALTSHGRGASRLLIGSVADKVLRGTNGSILLRRTPASKAVTPRRARHARRAAAPKRGS